MSLLVQYQSRYQALLENLQDRLDKLKSIQEQTDSTIEAELLILQFNALITILKNTDIEKHTSLEQDKIDFLDYKIALLTDVLNLWKTQRFCLQPWQSRYPLQSEESAVYWKHHFPPYAGALLFDAAVLATIITLSVMVNPVVIVSLMGLPLLVLPFAAAEHCANNHKSTDKTRKSVRLNNQKFEIAHTANRLNQDLKKVPNIRSLFFAKDSQQEQTISSSEPVVAVPLSPKGKN